MNCRKCDRLIPDGSAFCNHCGAKQTAPQRSRRQRANGEGSAYKRGKTWTAVVVVGWHTTEDGKAIPDKRYKGGFATKKEALAYVPVLRDWKSRNPDADITLKDLFDRWEPYYEERIGASTMNGHRAALKHLKDLWNVRFASIGIDDMQECVDNCGRGRRTKENIKSLLMQLYKYANSRHIVEYNDAQYIYCGEDDTKTRPAFTADQLEKIRLSIGKYPFAEYVYCMCYLGFRPNEMLQLQRGAYHKTSSGIEYLVGGFKTEAGTDRIVTISPKIAPIIRQLVASDRIYLFPKEDGSRMDDAHFREKVFYPFMAWLGIQPIPDDEHPAVYKPYSCRHTFANLLKTAQGADTEKAALMGHTDYSMTKEYQSANDITLLSSITNCL